MDENSQLYKIRHSMAHVLAQAVKAKFPKAKLGFGPAIENGFYYDFDFGGAEFGEAQLKDLEKDMRKIINQGQTFERVDGDFQTAQKVLKDHADEPYKQENLQNLHDRGEKNFSFYKNGGFMDVCEGPHVGNTKELPADGFKLDRIAGAFWLGDEKRPMLTRIYGLAFENKEQLQDYLKRRELAANYDHKKLGKELELFYFDDEIGKGLPLWLPAGAAIRNSIERYAEEIEFKYGYQRVATPHITKKNLFERSQHIPAYLDSMFPPMLVKDQTADGTVRESEYYLKPMNCPFHHTIYASRPRSYRELPLRLAEYGTVYRYEQSGELSGLIRVRCMAMNDAHIYLRHEQFRDEFRKILAMYKEFFDTFKLSEYTFRLSLHSKDDPKFKGDSQMWEKGEKLLANVMDEMGVPYFAAAGEAAFYGPKVDIQFRNIMGREETVSTIQADFLSPKNFNLKYVDEHGQEQEPMIIHRAPLSTHERFVSFLIEYYGGAFPAWCAPVQLCFIPVTDKATEYAKKLQEELHAVGVRLEVDDSNNSFNKKIRTNSKRKIPVLAIVGDKEADEQTITLRRYGIEEQETLSFADFKKSFLEEIHSRKMLREPMKALL